MKICGVYKITNKETGKFYIGSSVDIRQRWYAHKSKLRRGVHSNQHLQNSWNKYGEDFFLFEVLIEVNEESLLDEEQKLIDETCCLDRDIGYNKSSCTAAPFKGMRHSPDVVEKCRKASQKRKVTEETRNKLKASATGRKHSKEARRKMSEAKKGIAPAIAYSSPTEEGRKKISEFAKTRTGHKNPNSKLTPEQVLNIKKDFEDGTMTNGKIAEKYNVSLSTIKRIKYGKTKY
jgi:group I intron endonuclease